MSVAVFRKPTLASSHQACGSSAQHGSHRRSEPEGSSGVREKKTTQNHMFFFSSRLHIAQKKKNKRLGRTERKVAKCPTSCGQSRNSHCKQQPRTPTCLTRTEHASHGPMSVASARPFGSGGVETRHGFSCSPATVHTQVLGNCPSEGVARTPHQQKKAMLCSTANQRKPRGDARCLIHARGTHKAAPRRGTPTSSPRPRSSIILKLTTRKSNWPRTDISFNLRTPLKLSSLDLVTQPFTLTAGESNSPCFAFLQMSVSSVVSCAGCPLQLTLRIPSTCSTPHPRAFSINPFQQLMPF